MALLAGHLARFPGDGAAHAALGGLAFQAKDWALADTHLSLAAEQAQGMHYRLAKMLGIKGGG